MTQRTNWRYGAIIQMEGEPAVRCLKLEDIPIDINEKTLIPIAMAGYEDAGYDARLEVYITFLKYPRTFCYDGTPKPKAVRVFVWEEDWLSVTKENEFGPISP